MVATMNHSSTKQFQWFYFCYNLTLMTLAQAEAACQMHSSETEHKSY